MEVDANGLEVLDAEECLRLLGTKTLGRIGVSIDALPAVLPVNYVLDGDQVIIRTSRGTKLSAATRHNIVAFEVDDIDPPTGIGWSVMVRGLAREISDPPRLESARQAALANWLDPDRSRHVAVSTDLISGRRGPGGAHHRRRGAGGGQPEVLVDDHEVVRRGVRELLEASGEVTVVGEADSVATGRDRIAVARPDVAVLDVQLPDGSGIELCRDLRSEMPDMPCLMLTSFPDDDALLDAVVAGASGYVLKQVRGADLIEAVQRVAAGESLIDPAQAERAAERLRRGVEEDERLKDLTPQERRILDLLAEGRTNRQIAEEMYLAEKTVKNYVSNLLAKMGMGRRTEAAVYAARLQARRPGS